MLEREGNMQRYGKKLVVLVFFLLVLPITGILLVGKDASLYLQFPPLTRYVQHASFSWPVFVLLTLLVIAVCGPFGVKIIATGKQKLRVVQPCYRFPRWGIFGLSLTLVSWFLAWNRFPWFTGLQPYTFFPIWFGYILTVNGLIHKRKSTCLMTRNPFFFLSLFPLSCFFWWFFEYLNRFVQNWHYLGVEEFSSLAYVTHASICFSTVLPAVLSTEEYLATFPRLTNHLQNLWPLTIQKTVPLGWLLLATAGSGLGLIGVYPDYLFPLLWISPFLIIIDMQIISGEETVLAPIKKGDWRPVWLPACAALICGFFWELWNYKSLAHWEYSVPFVQKFHFFKMPILGYAGYLPFGLECKVVTGLLHNMEKMIKDKE